MADPSPVSMDSYRFMDPNETTIQPNLWQDTTALATDDDGDGSAYSRHLRLLESLASAAVATTAFLSGNSSENGTGLSTTSDIVWDPCDTENPLFNCSVLEFLEYYQGPQMMPFLKAIMVSNLSLASSATEEEVEDGWMDGGQLSIITCWPGGDPIRSV